MAFIDYGDTDVATDFRQLPESLRNLPEMVAHCCLYKGSENIETTEPPYSMNKFRELRLDTLLHIELIDINSKPNVVRLFLDAEMNREIRVIDDEEVVATASNPLSEEIDDASVKEAPAAVVEAFVSWVLSSGDFYLQIKANLEALEEMVERLGEAPGFDVVADPQVGDLCAARFVDDETFYRARVLSVDPDNKGKS